MTDYIRRKDALACAIPLYTNPLSDWEAGWIDAHEEIMDKLKDIPLVEPVLVRHGVWKKVVEKDCYECSQCGWKSYVRYNYCTECGAKMGEGYENE